MREIRQMQRQDPLIESWRKAVIDCVLPKKLLLKGDLTMKRQFKNLFIKRGILFREVQENGKEMEQLLLPEKCRIEVMRGLHDDMGHPGIERTMRLLRERFYWPGMSTDVENWIKKCDRCIRRKARIDKAPLVNIHTSYPLELVCMDFLTLEPSKGNIGNILIITDHFTKYALAIPTKNQTAKTVAEALYNNFIIHYGIPTRLHSDQGANFESQIIKELCELFNIKKSHTTPYHPQGNAGPERFNRTLLNMLGTLEVTQKIDWKKYVNSLVFAYNCTPHETTRVSPYELMFGRRPHLPIDKVFENARQEHSTQQDTQEYIQDLKLRMQKTRDIVHQHLDRSKNKQKKYYDRKVKAAKITVGDKVLVRKMAFDGKHKIADKFDEEIYEVIEQPRSDIPVFKIKSGEKIRTIHRNLLFLVNDQEVIDVEEESIESEESIHSMGEKSSMEDIQLDNEQSDVTTDTEDEGKDDVVLNFILHIYIHAFNAYILIMYRRSLGPFVNRLSEHFVLFTTSASMIDLYVSKMNCDQVIVSLQTLAYTNGCNDSKRIFTVFTVLALQFSIWTI